MSEPTFSRPAEPLSPPPSGESRPAVPDTEPVHAKVRIGAWTAESFAFARRYFPRLLLLAFLHGLLFIGISPYWFPPPCRVLLSRTALILFFVSGWMILGWTIRAVRTDSGSWKNLLFPSRRTLPNLVVLAALVFSLWFACGYLLTHCRAFRSCPIQLELRCLFALIWILVLARLALSAHLVLDRGFGPFRALKNSWRFTRSNVIPFLIVGYLIAAAAAAFAFLLFQVCSLSGLDRLLHHHFPGLGPRRLAAPFYILLCTVFQPFITALSAVFYLTATGQPRPGARRRAAGPSAEDPATSV